MNRGSTFVGNDAVAASDSHQSSARPPSAVQGISRRAFLQYAGASTVMTALAACSARVTGLEVKSGNRVQLVFQDCRCLGEQLLLEDFHRANPNIEVFYVPDPDNFEEKMLADMQAGVAPDLLVGCCDTLPIWAQQGYLLDLRPYVAADLDQSTISDWDKAQYQSFFAANGVQFALPKYHGALALYYNKDMFDAIGVEYPDGSWTHTDYQIAMTELGTKGGLNGTGGVWASMVDIGWERIQVHINGWGGHLVDPNNPAHSYMANPEAMMAMEWLRARMWDDRVMASKLDVNNLNTRDAFIQQKLAMVEEGSWALRDILEGAQFRLGVAPFPAGPVRRVTLATTDGFAIYSGTKHPESAWELIKFLTGHEYGRAMIESQLLQPARASLVNEWVDVVRREYPSQASDLDLNVFAAGHIEGYSVVAEVFANMTDARSLVLSAWEQIYTLGQARVDIMKQVSASVDAVQQKNG